MPLTQSQLVGEVADRSGLSKADTKAVLEALEDVVLGQLADAEKVKIGGVVLNRVGSERHRKFVADAIAASAFSTTPSSFLEDCANESVVSLK